MGDIETFGLTHIALAVQDAERAFRFYQDVFGMVAVYRENGFIQAQTPGCRDVLVLEETGSRVAGSGGIAHFGFRLVDPADIDEAVRAVERAGGEILSRGIAHFGFRLVDPNDIDEAARAVERAGGEILSRGEFCPGEPYVFCRDPDGYEIEIWH